MMVHWGFLVLAFVVGTWVGILTIAIFSANGDDSENTDHVHAAGGCYCHECIHRGDIFCTSVCEVNDDTDFCSRGERDIQITPERL